MKTYVHICVFQLNIEFEMNLEKHLRKHEHAL